MKKSEIRVMGDVFTLISVLDPKEYDVTEDASSGTVVLIYPSFTEDFAIELPAFPSKTHPHKLSAAVAAACYLVKYKGLPIDEISFDVMGEKIEVFHTGGGEFSVILQKCKQKFTKSKLFVSGCYLEFADSDEHPTFRIIRCDDVALFDKEKLKHTVLPDVPKTMISVALEEKEGVVHAILGFLNAQYVPDKLCVISAMASFLNKYDLSGTLDGNSFCAKTSFCGVAVSVMPECFLES